MKSPLSYQCTDYDCGPTTILNALSFLFERDEIPPEIVRHVMLYTLDAYDRKGEACRSGTSMLAMQFLAGWLNHFSAVKKFPLACERLTGREVHLGPVPGQLERALQDGGVAIVKVMLDCWHYVLFTGIEREAVLLFDPYYRERPFREPGIELIVGQPLRANRRVARALIDREETKPYACGPLAERECVLMFNTTRRRPTPDIEYMI